MDEFPLNFPIEKIGFIGIASALIEIAEALLSVVNSGTVK